MKSIYNKKIIIFILLSGKIYSAAAPKLSARDIYGELVSVYNRPVTVTYTINVINSRTENAANFIVVDNLPEGFRFKNLVAPAGWSAVATEWSPDDVLGQQVKFTPPGAILPAKTSATIIFNVTLPIGITSGFYKNVAWAFSDASVSTVGTATAQVMSIPFLKPFKPDNFDGYKLHQTLFFKN